jgi:hypothetical protein
MDTFITIGLIVGVLAIIGSWVFAIHMIKSEKYGDVQADAWTAEAATLPGGQDERPMADAQAR